MVLGSWKAPSFSRAAVDSALLGSQDDASLFWTSVSFWAKPPRPATRMIQNAATIHFVMGPVSVPAI
jgi:hypothetical protein